MGLLVLLLIFSCNYAKLYNNVSYLCAEPPPVDSSHTQPRAPTQAGHDSRVSQSGHASRGTLADSAASLRNRHAILNRASSLTAYFIFLRNFVIIKKKNWLSKFNQ